MKKETKSFSAQVELKENSDQSGEFQAVFALFDDIDKHGDLTIPGAFHEGQKVKVSAWGHNWDSLPVGKGTIHQDDKKAWIEGKFFLDTEGGRETYQTVKNLEDLQEWSYGFAVEEAGEETQDGKSVRVLRKLDVFEVSPVLRGAGNNTHTTIIKTALGDESEDESEGKDESEADEVGNESGASPKDILFLLDTIEEEANHATN